MNIINLNFFELNHAMQIVAISIFFIQLRIISDNITASVIYIKLYYPYKSLLFDKPDISITTDESTSLVVIIQSIKDIIHLLVSSSLN